MKMIFLIMFPFPIGMCSTMLTMKLSPITNHSESNVIKTRCLKYILERNVYRSDIVMVLRNVSEVLNDDVILFTMTLTNVICAYVSDRPIVDEMKMSTKRFAHRTIETITLYLLESDVQSIEKLLKILADDRYLNTRARFILIVQSAVDVNDNRSTATTILSKIFNIFWSYYIYNSLVMLCLEACNVYTWFPYDKASKCGTNFVTFEKIVDCHLCTSQNYYNNCQSQNCHNEKWRNINGPSDASVQNLSTLFARHWDRKYVRAFFSYTYRPHGMIEYRQRHLNETFKLMKMINDTKIENMLPPARRRLYNEKCPEFFEKIPSNLNGCQFVAVVFVWPPFVTPPHVPWIGLEHKLLLDISRYMNFELVEKYFTDTKLLRELYKSGDYQKFLHNFSADMAFGNIYPNRMVHEYYDYSIGYLYDYVNWVVPVAANQPLWLNLINCFSLELWTIISIVMVTFSLLYTAIEYMSENRQTGFLDCINVALGISIGKLPTSTVSQLILMLTTPTTEKQITTQEELVAAKIPFGFPRNFEIHLERSNSTNNPYFVQNNKVCTFHSCLKRMATQPFATLGNRMYLEYSIAFEHRNVKFFTITKPVAKSFVEMLMTKGFPLRDKINVKLRKMIEIGYLAASQKYYHKLVANVSIYNHHSYKKFANLQMEHFTSAFLLYITGITASIIAFSVEIFLKHHRQ